jgi:uncharacterized protein (TIGR02284 family)
MLKVCRDAQNLASYYSDRPSLCGCGFGPLQGQGRWGFRDFPHSIGSEGESQWQLPNPAQFLISILWRIAKMSSPSKDLKETELALRSVIQVLIDGQDGFKKLGEQIKDEALKEYFLAESLTRAQFRGVLESILHQEGVHDVKESGTAAGTIRRAWGDFKSALGGGDSSLLATAEEGEQEAIEAYAKASETYLPLPVRQALTTQAAHIDKSHEFIKAALDTKE